MADAESCGKPYFAKIPETGDIVLSIDVDRIGEIRDLKIVKSGGEAADHAAMRALRLDPNCRLTAGRDRDGAPIDSQFSFVFHREPPPPPSYPELDDAASARAKPPEVDAAACGRAARYPVVAAAAGAEGWVSLYVRVEADGSVSRARVRSSSARALEAAALEAIHSAACRFSPATVDGRAVVADLVYLLHFQELPR